jgi:hypothetical protein
MTARWKALAQRIHMEVDESVSNLEASKRRIIGLRRFSGAPGVIFISSRVAPRYGLTSFLQIEDNR